MDVNKTLDDWYANSKCDITVVETNKVKDKKFSAIAIDYDNDISFKASGKDKYEALSTLKKMVCGEYLG